MCITVHGFKCHVSNAFHHMKKFEISFIFTSFLIGSKSNMKSLASIIKSSELAVGVNRATTTGNETETVGTVVNERGTVINETETVINETGTVFNETNDFGDDGDNFKVMV